MIALTPSVIVFSSRSLGYIGPVRFVTNTMTQGDGGMQR
jgi:hypothetical protein